MSRRIPTLLTTLLLLLAPVLAIGCGDDEGGDATAAAPAAEGEEKLKVALLTSGLTNDGGFNQWAAEAAKKLEAEGEIELQIRQQLADPTAAEPVIRQFASRGYDLVIGHGIDVSEPILKVAKEFPEVHFATTGDVTLKDKLGPNVDGWTYDFGQFGYVGGFVAGAIEGIDTVGIVGGPKLPFIVATQEGFKAGLKSENPDAKVEEVFTGEFYDGAREQEATKGLVRKGAQLIYATAEGNGVAPAAKQAGVPTIGTNRKGSPAARDVNITSASLNLYPPYKGYVDGIRDGSFGKRFVVGDLSNEGIQIEEVKRVTDAVPSDLQERVADLAQRLKSGELKLPSFFE